MTIQLASGATNISIDVQIVDDAGLPVTGLVANTFPAITISSGRAADVVPTLSDLDDLDAEHTPGGVFEKDGGDYVLDLPDLPDGIHTIRGEASGKRLVCPRVQVGGEMALTDDSRNSLVGSLTGLTGSVTVPRVARGRKLRLIVGDDYLDAIGRAIPWDLDQAGDLPDFSTGWTVAMHVLPCLPGSSPVTFTGSIDTGNGSNRAGLLEAEAADTALLRTGEAMWQLEFTETSSSRKTVLLDGQATIERRAGT